MKPYKRSNKTFMLEFRAANRLGRARLLIIEFSKDVYSLWRYGAPFPTFLKIIGTLLLCLVATLPLLYPFFVVAFTYFIYESLFLSWWLNEPWRFLPRGIFQRILSFAFQPSKPSNMWKVREVLTRGILLTHSLATSVDYLCVMQGLLEDSVDSLNSSSNSNDVRIQTEKTTDKN